MTPLLIAQSLYLFSGDDLTAEEIEDMIAETDTDGSGTVDYEGNKFLKLNFVVCLDWPLTASIT